jgi:protein-disulfide isomerase
MHERLFETASEWSGQENLTEQFTSYAADLGLDTDVFVTCLEAEETAAQVQAEFEQGAAAGVQGVPAFFINDWFLSGAQPFEVFEEVIEAALRGEHPPPTPTPLPPGATIFDSNPERPGYTYGGDATRGSDEAELVLVGFIDFQSAENREHSLEAWPELEEKYVEPGKVRLVVKHFPAADQPLGFKAAEAAECAGQQEAFWAMHDLLFRKQEEWSQMDAVTPIFEGYAADLDLDVDAFATCLDEGQTRDKVEQDFTITQENQFPAAPQFFIIMGERAGNVPADQLQQVIEELLAQ